MSKTNQAKLFSARDIHMPRLRQLRDEIREQMRSDDRKREALRKAEAAESWAEIKATTWKMRGK